MYKGKTFLAIIPARGGSKGIANKNIKQLLGKPLIAYTIETALKSNVFDKVLVSTDSKEIAEIAKFYGANVPFLRPSELATDTANSMDVIVHAINFLKNNGENFDYTMKLQPTSPLRTVDDIVKAIDIIIDKNANSVISVSEAFTSPLWMNTLPKDLSMENFLDRTVRFKNRQELPKYYKLNGSIFLAKTNALLTSKDWFMKKSYALITDPKYSVDIDSIIDFKLAEILIRDLFDNLEV